MYKYYSLPDRDGLHNTLTGIQMTDPVVGVKYRIQNVDFLTCIEALEGTTATVRMRPLKKSDFQYWKFETVSGYTDFYYVRNVGDNTKCLYCDGSTITATTPSTTYSLTKVWNDNGSCRLTVRKSSTDYWVLPDEWDTYVNVTSAKDDTNIQKWQLIPVPSPPPAPPAPTTGLQTGNYRIRNLNGRSLLTLPDAKSIGSTGIFVRSQRNENDKLKAYQRWIVTLQDSGQYVIQNAGDNSYLGCSVSIPAVGDQVVGLTDVYLWDIKSIGGFAWSISLLTYGLSVGVGDYDIENEDEISLVSSDNTSSQIWFMEKYIALGNDVIYAKREVPEGTYYIQSAHDPHSYMKAVSSPWRVAPGTNSPTKFNLEYVDDDSSHFTLSFSASDSTTQTIINYGGHIALTDSDGSELVLLEKDKGDPGYVICLPDHGYPPKIISNRTKISEGNDVFCIDNMEAGETIQMWNFVVPPSKSTSTT